jgi:hypothetical protein
MLAHEKWFEFWKSQRDHVPNITIAEMPGPAILNGSYQVSPVVEAS